MRQLQTWMRQKSNLLPTKTIIYSSIRYICSHGLNHLLPARLIRMNHLVPAKLIRSKSQKVLIFQKLIFCVTCPRDLKATTFQAFLGMTGGLLTGFPEMNPDFIPFAMCEILSGIGARLKRLGCLGAQTSTYLSSCLKGLKRLILSVNSHSKYVRDYRKLLSKGPFRSVGVDDCACPWCLYHHFALTGLFPIHGS